MNQIEVNMNGEPPLFSEPHERENGPSPRGQAVPAPADVAAASDALRSPVTGQVQPLHALLHVVAGGARIKAQAPL